MTIVNVQMTARLLASDEIAWIQYTAGSTHVTFALESDHTVSYSANIANPVRFQDALRRAVHPQVRIIRRSPHRTEYSFYGDSAEGRATLEYTDQCERDHELVEEDRSFIDLMQVDGGWHVTVEDLHVNEWERMEERNR